MATEFKLPELGENVTSATISRVLVKVGDTVALDQPVIEVETDKAVAEIPSTVAGSVTEVRVTEGQRISTGDVILVVSEGDAAKSPAPTPPQAAVAAPAPAAASAPAPAAASAPAPAAASAPAPAAASAPAPAAAPAPSAVSQPASAPAPRPEGSPVLSSPSVRRLAREMGVDINAVPSSDPSGRITAQDIMNFAKGSTGASPAEAKPAESVKTATPGMESGQDKWGTLELEPMNAIRRKTAEHLTECWRIPHVTHFDQADITDLEAVRKKNAKKVESAGGRLNTISFILKVAVEALQRFPKFNASLDLENQRVIFKKYYHIGVAVDTPNGLLVPVLRDVDRKSLVELSVELPQLAEKARTRKLSLEDMQGGTFTISNLGGLGGVGFTPIINAPQVAILGVSRASVAPVYIDGVFQPRTLLPLSLSYDHRLIDGADAARFLRWVAEALEDPWRMFLGE